MNLLRSMARALVVWVDIPHVLPLLLVSLVVSVAGALAFHGGILRVVAAVALCLQVRIAGGYGVFASRSVRVLSNSAIWIGGLVLSATLNRSRKPKAQSPSHRDSLLLCTDVDAPGS
jgi:hypothetical protein